MINVATRRRLASAPCPGLFFGPSVRYLLHQAMTKTQLLCLAVVVAAVAISSVSAQTNPPPATTTAPATRPRHALVMPKGFKLITINARNVLCEPNDESWVSTALGKVTPTTKPATLPATLLQRLAAQRDNIIRSLTTDLAMTDMNPIAKAYDSDLTPAVKKLDELHVPIYYLVSTPERIADLMRNGWQDPRFYY